MKADDSHETSSYIFLYIVFCDNLELSFKYLCFYTIMHTFITKQEARQKWKQFKMVD